MPGLHTQRQQHSKPEMKSEKETGEREAQGSHLDEWNDSMGKTEKLHVEKRCAWLQFPSIREALPFLLFLLPCLPRSLENSSFDSSDWHSANSSNLVDILQRKTKRLVNRTSRGLDGIESLSKKKAIKQTKHEQNKEAGRIARERKNYDGEKYDERTNLNQSGTFEPFQFVGLHEHVVPYKTYQRNKGSARNRNKQEPGKSSHHSSHW